MRLLVAVPALSLFGALACSCGGGNAASQLAKAPEFNPKDQTKCGVAKSQSHPLIVEWPSSDRLELETRARQGIVAVRYVGCEMSVLERCSIAAKYNYVGGTRKQDELDINDEDDLYANLPVGAAKLEGKLQRSGRLTVTMDLVGRYESERPNVRVDDLHGDCTGATHFIYGVTLGAFDFYAGGKAELGGGAGVGAVGAGAHSQADRASITKDGDPDACAKAAPDDKTPPAECGALIRIEVVPIIGASATPGGEPAWCWAGKLGLSCTRTRAQCVGFVAGNSTHGFAILQECEEAKDLWCYVNAYNAWVCQPTKENCDSLTREMTGGACRHFDGFPADP